MKRRLALAFAAAVALLVGAAPNAHAACDWLRCSSVGNASSSEANILVASQWQAQTYNTSTKATIRPGHTSSEFLRDTNAFWIPTGCEGSSRYGTYYGGRWYKPLAGYSYIITVRCNG